MKNSMIRKNKRYNASVIIPLINEIEKYSKLDLDGDLINIGTLRLQCFKKYGIKCSNCGLEGKFFYKEKAREPDNFHINLYGITPNQKEMLMTSFNINPKAKRKIELLKTMCEECGEKERGYRK